MRAWLDGIAGTDVIVPDAAALKAIHDVVLTADGKVIEAVAGVHGDNLTLPKQVDLAEPTAALDELYRGGSARSVPNPVLRRSVIASGSWVHSGPSSDKCASRDPGFSLAGDH